MNELRPWHAETWSLLSRGREQGNLPHALLITGLPGMGKLELATLLSQSMLCNQTQDDHLPCGQCQGCQLFAAGSHPDFMLVAPEGESRVIKVDQIRAVVEFFTLTSQYNGPKIVVIDPAETMNASACNSLLKTLEEPPAQSFLVLVSAQPSRLPATIRSRCQSYRCPPPSDDQALEWLRGHIAPGTDPVQLLRLGAGAPLAALELATESELEQRTALFEQFCRLLTESQDPVALAEGWAKSDCKTSLKWLHDWAADMIRLRQAGDAAALKHEDFRSALHQLAGTVDLRALHRWYEHLGRALRLVNTSANDQLLMEDVLLDWVKVARPVRR